MEKRLELLKNSRARVIVGIETGSVPGRLGAVIVEVSGSWAGTVLDLHSFQSVELPPELVAALKVVAGEKKIDTQEQADVNFLILHHINTLFFDLLVEAEVDSSEVDLIGLKGMEIGGMEFPDDPGALSELTGCVVAACFRIGPKFPPQLASPQPPVLGLLATTVKRLQLMPPGAPVSTPGRNPSVFSGESASTPGFCRCMR